MQGNIRKDTLIGIDVGTTVLKAAAFDARSGAPLASANRRLTVRTASGGVREQSVVSLDRALTSVLRDLHGQLGSAWRCVSGIGLAAQGGSTIIADRRTGPATYVNLAPGPDNTFSIISAPVEMLGDGTHADLKLSIRGWMKPRCPIAQFLEEYGRAGGTHHSALILGDHTEALSAMAAFLGCGAVEIGCSRRC